MRWLAGYAPEVFEAVLDAVEPSSSVHRGIAFVL
jgi:hypothetical protein